MTPRAGAGRVLAAVAVAQALACCASAFFGGFYDFSLWGALSAATLVLLAATVVAHPRVPPAASLAVAGSLAALLALSLLSLSWADSNDRAWTEVNRLVLYLASFLLAGVVLRSRRDVRALAGAIGAAIGAVVLVTAARVLGGDTRAFLTYRLDAPVDYINGVASLMLMGIWPLAALAERCRDARLAGAAVALASLEASLLVLTQARAVIPALLGSAALMVWLVPGRVGRFWTLFAIAAGAGLALPWTLAVYSARDAARPDYPPSAAVAHAGLAAIVGALVAGAGWVAARAFAARTRAPALRRLPRRAAVVLLAAIPLAGLAVDPDPLRTIRNDWHTFAALRDTPATATIRFTDVGGYRYDLWRVALAEFDAEPLRGIGAGGYGLRYYQLRRNPESVRQPHSLELQLLAELGLPGLLALLAGVGGAGWALRRARGRDPAASVALGGLAAVWFLHTSVDWVYDIPGLTVIALVAVAGLGALGRGAEPDPAPSPRRARTVAWTLALLGLVAFGAPALARQYLAEHDASVAQAQLAADPAAALRETGRSLSLDGSRPETYYTRAAAFARLGDYPDARATLLEAVRIEPLNYVPWALLGDLATRRADAAHARVAYARATALDPRDAALFGGR